MRIIYESDIIDQKVRAAIRDGLITGRAIAEIVLTKDEFTRFKAVMKADFGTSFNPGDTYMGVVISKEKGDD